MTEENSTIEQIRLYCEQQEAELTALAGMRGTRISNETYLTIRNGMYRSLPSELVNRAVYDLTLFLAFTSLLPNYSKDFQ